MDNIIRMEDLLHLMKTASALLEEYLPRQVMELYASAQRFDEGALFQSDAYAALRHRKADVTERLAQRLGTAFLEALNEYDACTFPLEEMEAQHFFYEGYKAGLAAGSKTEEAGAP